MYKGNFFAFIIFIIFSLNVCSGETMYKQTIAIDLDGVLDNYTKYEEGMIPPVKKGAKEFVKELYDKNYKLILFTNRSPMHATKWLVENRLDKYFSDVTNVKPTASIYIDDRAIIFRGDYKEAIKEVENFKPWWKEKDK